MSNYFLLLLLKEEKHLLMYWKTEINNKLQMRYKIIWDILQKYCSDGEAC